MRRSEQRLRAAVLAAPYSIMLHAEDGEVLEISRKWTELTGYTREQIKTHFDWIALACSAEEQEHLQCGRSGVRPRGGGQSGRTRGSYRKQRATHLAFPERWARSAARRPELPNRLSFRDRLSAALAQADRGHGPTGLMLLELDEFKGVNLALGQAVGDLALVQVAERLKRCIRTGDTVARIGNDEFAVILESVIDAHAAAAAARRLLNALSEPIVVAGQQVEVAASSGIALYPTDAQDLDPLIKCAELAMHFAKRSGPNSAQMYCPELRSHTEQEISRRARIDELLARLTPREREVMDLLVAGQNNKTIGQFLGVSPRTVEIHRAKVMQKMRVDSLQDLVRVAIEARTPRSAM